MDTYWLYDLASNASDQQEAVQRMITRGVLRGLVEEFDSVDVVAWMLYKRPGKHHVRYASEADRLFVQRFEKEKEEKVIAGLTAFIHEAIA